MASVNKVIILGNLGRDPETRFSGNNLQITSMSVATTSYRRSAETQERVEETNGTVWSFSVARLKSLSSI